MPDLEYLTDLLRPAGLDLFLSAFRNRTFLHVPAADGKTFDHVLSLPDLDTMLQSGALPAVLFDVVNKGTHPAPLEWSVETAGIRGHQLVIHTEKLLRQYREGATLVFHKAQLSLPKLGEACRRLSAECGFQVGTNLYITPPNGQGFPAHLDTHDVVILQISGRKHWTLYPEPGQPFELEMKTGDLLFIPRNLGHEARCAAECSIHATLSFNAVFGFDLVKELAAVAETDPLFQAPVPGALATPAEQSDYAARFAGLVAGLASRHSVSSLMARLESTHVQHQPRGWASRLSESIQSPSLTLKSIVRRRPGVSVEVVGNAASRTVRFAGGLVTVPLFLSVCLDRILEPAPFVIGDLPGLLGGQGKVDLVRRFVDCGLLTIDAV